MSETSGFNFDELQNAAFTTSSAADEITTEFLRRITVKGKNYVARLALARSLAIGSQPEACLDSSGKVIKGANLFDKDSRAWVSLLIEHAEADDATVATVQDLIRRHWARGARLLEEEWKDCGGDHDKFILRLAQQAGLRGSGGMMKPPRPLRVGTEPRPLPIVLPIGPMSLNVETGERVSFAVNGQGENPNIALMGTLGTGKTTVAKSMLKAFREQAGTPVLVFDMGKGDLSTPEIASMLGAEVLKPPKALIPLDLFALPTGDEDARRNLALRFRESVARIRRGLGDVQKPTIGSAAEKALQGRPPVRLSDIGARLKEHYAAEKKRPDALSALFEDISKMKLFDPKLSPMEFFSRSWIVDMHELNEEEQRVVAFLMLDAAATHMNQLGDSALDDQGNRAMRLVLAIDEAQRVLAYEQASLIDLIRRGRSRGVSVITISQSPEDFETGDEDFLANIGLGVCLKTNAKAAAVKRMLGRSEDLNGLETGVAVTRLGSNVVKVKAWDPSAFKR